MTQTVESLDREQFKKIKTLLNRKGNCKACSEFTGLHVNTITNFKKTGEGYPDTLQAIVNYYNHKTGQQVAA